MSSSRSDPLITQPSVSNPMTTQPGTTVHHEKANAAPGASMHRETLPSHSTLRTNLRKIRDNAIQRGRQYLPILGSVAALLFLATLVSTVVPAMYNMLPGITNSHRGYSYSQPMYGQGMTGQMLQRGQEVVDDMYDRLPSRQQLGRGLERGVEKGMEYMRDIRDEYGYSGSMENLLGQQRDMLGQKQGIMSSKIWPWNWFSTTHYGRYGSGYDMTGGRWLPDRSMLPRKSSWQRMFNPLNWGIWPWNWNLFSDSSSGSSMDLSSYRMSQISEDAVWKAIERVADEIKRDAHQHSSHALSDAMHSAYDTATYPVRKTYDYIRQEM